MIRYLKLSILGIALLFLGYEAYIHFIAPTPEPPVPPNPPVLQTYNDPVDQPPKPPYAENRIQVALILDTSNSMDGLIEQAKSQLWKMVNELAKIEKDGETPQIEISLFEYGNDNLSAMSGYVRQVGRLTTDLEWVSTQLFQLRTNGGEEYCGWALRDASELLDWSKKESDLKMIFIAGNEPFTQGTVDYKIICKNAKNNGIVVNTIHCGDYKTGVRESWKDGADLAGGQYMVINQNDQVAHIPTPYDDEVLQLNSRLNDTYIGYGLAGSTKIKEQKDNDVKSSKYGTANTRTRSFFKGKKSYKNKEWDLVDATEGEISVTDDGNGASYAWNSDAAFDSIAEEQLPEEMQGMDGKERAAYIEKKRKEREDIRAQLKEYEEKVEAYIAEKKKELSSKNTLDNVMMETIRKQATSKDYKMK